MSSFPRKNRKDPSPRKRPQISGEIKAPVGLSSNDRTTNDSCGVLLSNQKDVRRHKNTRTDTAVKKGSVASRKICNEERVLNIEVDESYKENAEYECNAINSDNSSTLDQLLGSTFSSPLDDVVDMEVETYQQECNASLSEDLQDIAVDPSICSGITEYDITTLINIYSMDISDPGDINI